MEYSEYIRVVKMSHSSVMPMSLSNKRTYVYAGVGGVCGVSAVKSGSGYSLMGSKKNGSLP